MPIEHRDSWFSSECLYVQRCCGLPQVELTESARGGSPVTKPNQPLNGGRLYSSSEIAVGLSFTVERGTTQTIS